MNFTPSQFKQTPKPAIPVTDATAGFGVGTFSPRARIGQPAPPRHVRAVSLGDPAATPPGEDEMAGVGSFSGKTVIHVFKERKIQTIDAKNKMD